MAVVGSHGYLPINLGTPGLVSLQSLKYIPFKKLLEVAISIHLVIKVSFGLIIYISISNDSNKNNYLIGEQVKTG